VTRRPPRVGVLALQGAVREHLEVLWRLGALAVKVRDAGELAQVQALVIPGGESTTMWRLARRLELLDPLRERLASGMPAFGSCAGMIMLADRLEGGVAGQETLGGIDMTVRRNAFGRQVDSFEVDVDFPALAGGLASPPDPFHGVFIRAPWVEHVGDGVAVLARIGSGPHAGRIVAVRQGPLVATSFHAELTPDLRVHRFFLDVVAEQMGHPPTS